MVGVATTFIKQMLPQLIERKLTKEELARYGEPYPTVASRKAIRQWPLEIPLDGKPADVREIVVNFSRWLEQTDLPKLLFPCIARRELTPCLDGATTMSYRGRVVTSLLKPYAKNEQPLPWLTNSYS
jgi:hypothetical protein